ncbi:MAG: SPOR domain-containing protein [Candidatus Riflebacteria bacterium]|nr:SPOR domain-containing protein [Candidatus Riflebacteria bacterium]
MADNIQREFDWGPPSESVSESWKDYFIYGFFLIFCVLAILLLIDFKKEQPFEDQNGSKTDKRQVITNSNSNSIEEVKTIQEITQKPKTINSKTLFTVQLGAFVDEETAKKAFSQITTKGYVASMTVPNDEFEMYKVFLGPFSNEKEANKIANELNESDFPCFVIEST